MEQLVVVEVSKSVDEVSRALEKAVADHHFGILHVHDIRQALAKKGVPFAREVRIFDICNPQRAREALEKNPLVAAALPCAIAVYSEGDKSTIVFVRPTVMLGLFGDTEMRGIAEEVEQSVRAIVEAAAR